MFCLIMIKKQPPLNAIVCYSLLTNWEFIELYKYVLAGAFRVSWESMKNVFLNQPVHGMGKKRTRYCNNLVHVVNLTVSFPPPRWWRACARRDSAASSVGALQTRVKASRVSEGCSVSLSHQHLASSPVESALITLSPRDNRDISASSMVGSKWMMKICSVTWSGLETSYTITDLCSCLYNLRHVHASFPLPLPPRCRLLQHET